jgi:hypothetical protein
VVLQYRKRSPKWWHWATPGRHTGSICHRAVVDASAGEVVVASIGGIKDDVSIAIVVVVGTVQADFSMAEAVERGVKSRTIRLVESRFDSTGRAMMSTCYFGKERVENRSCMSSGLEDGLDVFSEYFTGSWS